MPKSKKTGAELLAELAAEPTSTTSADASVATAPSEPAPAAEAAPPDAVLEAQRVMVIAIDQMPSGPAKARAIKEYTNSIGVGVGPDGAGALRCFPNGVAGPELIALVERNVGFIGIHCFNVGLSTGRLKVEGSLYVPRLQQPAPTEWDLVKAELVQTAADAAKVQGWPSAHITKITARLRDSLQEGDHIGGVDFFAVAITKPSGHTVALSRFDD
jgi:hypothetical protein